MKWAACVSFFFALVSASSSMADADQIVDTPFVQEYHEPYALSGDANDVRAIVVDSVDRVWAATRKGVFYLDGPDWKACTGIAEGPAFGLAHNAEGVWVAGWDGVYLIRDTEATKAPGINAPISAIDANDNGVIALGPDGGWRYTQKKWTPVTGNWSKNIRSVAIAPNESIWIATWMGLYHLDGQTFCRYFEPEDVFSGATYDVGIAPDGRVWAGSWGGITVLENGVCVNQITSEQGLPNWQVHSVTFDDDGTMWAGTALGVARYRTGDSAWTARNNGSDWSLRFSKRWLLNDDVRDIAFDSNGNAWVATAGGVSAIKRRMMTLADKADYYMDILLKRHVRAPWLVEKCMFPSETDNSTWTNPDDDNDGEYTNLYLMMECLRYAVTRDPQARQNATRAYEAMEFLQKVTGTDGFFARSVVPADQQVMKDRNEQLTPEEVAERRIRDPRWKYVPVRWHKSADGEWWWKGDTSSDEFNGHLMGYYYFHNLVADDAMKKRVAQHTDNILMHVINNNYTLTDPADGKATRWGVWTPDKLMNDPDWWVEGPINVFELLTFLRVGHYMTGKDIYQSEFERLVEKYDLINVHMSRPRAHRRSEISHIDDGMLTELGQLLMDTEPNEEYRKVYMEGLTWSYRIVENEQNPWFNFGFGMLGGKNFHLKESVEFLRDHPLDLRQWTLDNSKRDDIKMVRRPLQDPLQTDRMPPPSERGVMRWDKNPWAHIAGDFPHNGRMESSGVFWLLPYWMGRYAGYITEPRPAE